MKNTRKGLATMITVVVGLLLFVLPPGFSQDKPKKPKPEYIEANAEGTSTQLGRMVSVTITIYEYSTPEDQKALLEAFDQAGQEGLVNALSKMKAKGRIAIPGTLGYDLNYIRQFPTENGGRKIRFVTDRPIAFGELWSGTRSRDYDLSGGEVDLSKEKNKSAGTLAPACKFKLDKEKHLELELLQNPWKLVNIRYSK